MLESAAMLSARRWLGPLAVCGAALAMLLWSAGTWPDAIVDFGRELYVPWQLAQGKVLYRDIAYQNGPLSPYWNRLWFAVLGVSLRTLVVANLAAMAALLVLLDRLLREMAGALAATLGGLTFVLLFGFAQLIPIGNYNWLCPYSHEMTHGVLLSLAALYALWRSRASSRPRLWAALAGVALGLAFLTKVEVFVAAFAAVAALLLAGLLAGRDEAKRTALPLAAGLLAPPLVAWALLALAMPAGAALIGTLGSWAHLSYAEAAGERFYQAGA
ncbi:MAG TPA: glycosyltransferase family 39 protein, partial [Thermoanaerobaculia bacterium]